MMYNKFAKGECPSRDRQAVFGLYGTLCAAWLRCKYTSIGVVCCGDGL